MRIYSIIKKSYEKAEFLNLKHRDQEIYHKNLKAYRDLVNAEEYAIKRGLQEGLKEGLKKGLEKGRSEGKRDAAIEIAKNLLDILDNETIALKTDLSAEEIERLR